jgi:hypothetical protein
MKISEQLEEVFTSPPRSDNPSPYRKKPIPNGNPMTPRSAIKKVKLSETVTNGKFTPVRTHINPSPFCKKGLIETETHVNDSTPSKKKASKKGNSNKPTL